MRLVKTLICKIQYLFHPETKFWFKAVLPLLGTLVGSGGGPSRGKEEPWFKLQFSAYCFCPRFSYCNNEVILLWDFQCYFPGTVLSPHYLEFLL